MFKNSMCFKQINFNNIGAWINSKKMHIIHANENMENRARIEGSKTGFILARKIKN